MFAVERKMELAGSSTGHALAHSRREGSYIVMFRYLSSLRDQEDGQDLTEYALIIALVVILAVGAVSLMGTSITETMSTISSTLQSVF